MADKTYRIMVINPGSTSTKVGVFDGETEVFTKNVSHEASKLAEFASVSDQMPYRRDMILDILKENGVELSTIDAFVGRGGGLLSARHYRLIGLRGYIRRGVLTLPEQRQGAQ